MQGLLFHPHVYRKQVLSVSPEARPGDLVRIKDETGGMTGYGLFNPQSERRIRVLRRGAEFPAEFWSKTLERAVSYRREFLQLDRETDAYRVIHAEADGLSGLVVDRYGDVLSAEVYTPGMFQRADALLAELQRLCGTSHTILKCAPQTFGQEGFSSLPRTSPGAPEAQVITEFENQYRVEFREGHKTGFFCDQRENRKRLSELSAGKDVLDLCCYSGGFSIAAAASGGAASVTGVDLDEQAIAIARKNAQLNKVKIKFTHADAFAWMRDAIAEQKQFDIVVLDPPKLIHNRSELEDGRKMHFDLNRLALQLVRRGGLLLTCTCSGLLGVEDFQKLVCAAARQAGDPLPGEYEGRFPRRGLRDVRIVSRTGAAADHPIAADCPETEYLQAIWCRMES